MEETTVKKDCLFAVFIFPLTAGNHKQGQLHPDGTISAVVAVIVWLAVMSVLTEGGISHNIKTEVTLYGLVHFILAVNIIVGLIGCSFIASTTRVKGIDSLARFHGSVGARKLRIGFLWFFVIGTVLYCLENIFVDAICIVIKPGVSEWSKIDNVSDTVYNIFLCVFTVIQSSILHYFASYKFKHTTKIHYCMMLMIGANLSVWFHTHNMPSNVYRTGNNTFDSVGSLNCSTNKTQQMFVINQIFSKSKLIFRPTVLEFALLSVCLIFEMWSPHRNSSSREISPMAENELIYDADETDNDICDNEFTHLLRNGTVNYNSLSSDTSVISDTSSRLHCSFFVSVFVGVMIILPPMMMCILSITIYKHDITFHNIYRICYGFYNASVTLSMYYGFFTLKRYMKPVSSRRGGLQLREIVMLCTVFAVFQYYVYMILAGVFDRRLTITMVCSCFSISSEYLQIVFILQARRFEPREFGPKQVVFQSMIVVMAVLSLGEWALDGFIGTEYGFYNDIIKAIGDESWKRIKYTIYPVIVFYRFHTFFSYYSLYKMFVK